MANQYTTEPRPHALFIAAPGARVHTRITAIPESEITLEFDPARLTSTREGNDLVFTFPNDGKVTISNFFSVDTSLLPQFIVPNGSTITASDICTDSDPSPSGGSPVQLRFEGRTSTYADDAGSLLCGLDTFPPRKTGEWERDTPVYIPVDGATDRDALTDFSLDQSDIILRADQACGVFGSLGFSCGQEQAHMESSHCDTHIFQRHHVTDTDGARMIVSAREEELEEHIGGVLFDDIIQKESESGIVMASIDNGLCMNDDEYEYVQDMSRHKAANPAWNEGDRLSFTGLLESDEDFDHLLEHLAVNALDVQNNTLSLQIVEGGRQVDVSVRFQENEIQSFAGDYENRYGDTDGLNDALLAFVIQSMHN